MDYKKIKRVWCPALNDYVVFNSMGIRHLLRKRGKLRPKSERIRRIGLLQYATGIIGSPNALIVHQVKDAVRLKRKNGEKVPVKNRTHFWAFKHKHNEQIITVVVRQFKRGNKHFLSIY